MCVCLSISISIYIYIHPSGGFHKWWYSLVLCYMLVAIENGPVEIIDLPSYKMVIFHRHVSLTQGTPNSLDGWFTMENLSTNGG